MKIRLKPFRVILHPAVLTAFYNNLAPSIWAIAAVLVIVGLMTGSLTEVPAFMQFHGCVA